jgi:hypothetical protein
MKSTLHAQAKEIAKVMHRIAAWSNDYPERKKKSANLIKLPPVFLGGDSGEPIDGRKNLEAMIKVLADYQVSGLTLNELPQRYASYGGTVKGEEIGTRRIHNWMHQVAFGIRAAMIEMNDDEGDEAIRVASNVVEVLEQYPLVFVAREGNEYRPLRYASRDAKERWLCEEVVQQRLGTNYNSYGAQITDDEWCQNGVGMQYRVAHSSLKSSIEKLVKQAQKLDQLGQYTEADTIDEALSKIQRGSNVLDTFNNTQEAN